MTSSHFIYGLFVFFLALHASAAERTFRVFESKQITPNVERFYGKDGNAFATLFCNKETPQVMMVDSRMTDLDGKTFHFESYEACDNARTQARQLRTKCVVELVLEESTFKAGSRVSLCGAR